MSDSDVPEEVPAGAARAQALQQAEEERARRRP